jgi:TonB family protein
MQSVSQKIRTGLLELRTPGGLLYASPTFWQRLYLLWTFRHFRSLSRRVLSQRQQELVDQLSQAAMALERGKVARASIIGAVEDIAKISPRPRPVALPAADNLLQMPVASARLPVASAVGSELASLPQKRVEKKLRPMPESQPIARVSGPSAPTANRTKRVDFPRVSIPSALRLPPRKWLEWASGAALGAALLGVIFYVTEVRPSSISAASRQAPPAKSESHSAPVPPPTASSVVPVSEQTVTRGPAPVTAAANAGPDPIRIINPRVELPSPPPVESTISIPRVHVTGAPARNFIYPDAPNSTLTGTVNLRALIGPDGLVKHVDVLSGKPALARPAVDAMRHWRYSPPQSDGHPAEAETRVTMNFVGDDAVTIVFPKGDN